MSTNQYRRAIHSLEAFVTLFEENPHMELEGRLGKYDQRRRAFVSGVSQDYFMRIQSLLKSTECWSQQMRDQMSVDFFYPNNIRHSAMGNAARENSTVAKTVVATLTFVCPEREWDVRFRLCEEKPVGEIPTTDAYNKVRLKQRDSFTMLQAEMRYDMTVVQSGADKELAAANGDSKTYEVEVELLHLQGASSMAARLFVKFPQLLGMFDRKGDLVHMTFDEVENTFTPELFHRYGTEASRKKAN
jgi:hypothetical protein